MLKNKMIQSALYHVNMFDLANLKLNTLDFERNKECLTIMCIFCITFYCLLITI